MKKTKNEESSKGKETLLNVIISKDVLSFREALIILDLKASTLYKKTHKRTIPFFKPSPGRIYFLKEDLINYMLSNKQESIEDFENENNHYLNRKSHGNE